MKVTGASIIIKKLIKEKVEYIFGYPGGSVIPLFDELYNFTDKIKLIQPRHEQGGTHAADGYARSTGKTGVIVVTSGPGATNTVTGIATAYMDSVPLVIITGQVPVSMMGSDAFQEVDTTAITLPITKANFLIKDIKELAPSLDLAFHIAKSGRPGPVLVDIPSDIQKAVIEEAGIKKGDIDSFSNKQKADDKKINEVFKMLSESKKPLIISGGGIIISEATELLKKFVEKNNIPVITTLMGKGLYPAKSELYFDGLGMHGTYYGNYAVQNSDLILALGVRFSDRILGNVEKFAPNAKIVHVDIDRSEIEKNIQPILGIEGDVRAVLEKFLSFPELKTDFSDWIKELNKQKRDFPLVYEKGKKLKPQYLIELANKYFPEDTVVVSDVGQNQMWTAQFYKFKKPRTFLTTGGLGTMGFGLPAAMGAKVGKPDKEVLVISGDGGFQMNIQELMTIKRYALNVKILIVDNAYLGMVKQWQELFYNKRYSATPFTDNPDFGAIAKVIGIKSKTLKDWDKAEEIIKELALSKESMLIHALIDPDENVFPMVPAGASLNEILLNEEG
jgi:acetolactate synthase-1/2/3 large subunit